MTKISPARLFAVMAISLAFFAALAEAGFLAISLHAMGGLPFADDFSRGLIFWNDWMRQTCCAHSVRTVDAPSLAGRKAASFELRFDDKLVKGSKRSEFRLAATRFGKDYEYRFKTFLFANWQIDETPVLLMQMHNVPDLWKGEFGLAPPIDLEISRGDWLIRAAKGRTPTWLDRRGDMKEEILWRAPADFGRWVSWRIRVRWSTGDDGRLSIEKDGVTIVDVEGRNCYDNLLSPYMKIGVYVPAWKAATARPPVATRSALFTDIYAAEIRDAD